MTENLSVNNELLKITQEIIKKLSESLPKCKFNILPSTILYGARIKYGKVEFVQNVLEQEITMEFNCYRVMDASVYRKIKQDYKLGEGTFWYDDSKIVINLCLIGFEQLTPGSMKVAPDPRPAILHELEHAFQFIKNQRKGDDAYLKSLSFNEKKHGLFGKTKDKEKKRKEISTIIYSLDPAEIDAYANQLYLEMKYHCGDKNPRQFIKTTDMYGFYIDSANALRQIEADRDGYEKIIQEFGFTYDDFVKKYRRMLKRNLSKMGKILTRFMNERNA